MKQVTLKYRQGRGLTPGPNTHMVTHIPPNKQVVPIQQVTNPVPMTAYQGTGQQDPYNDYQVQMMNQ